MGDATCSFCTGEACARCLSFVDRIECDHDCIDRHGDRPCADEDLG